MATLDSGWTRTMDDGLTNAAWDEYDPLIKAEVTEYNARLAQSPGFTRIDWTLFKALLWVESGGPSQTAWTTRPMQIGNPGDKGYAVLKDGKEAAPLIMADPLKKDIKTGNINKPTLNIRAGIAYALTRHARSDVASVDDPKDPTVWEYTVVQGDSLALIAGKVGSTLESIRKLNPTALVLQKGQKIKYRKATMQRVLTGWYPVTVANLAARYNGGGDAAYQQKLDYVLNLFTKLKR